jgi:hypothetical protein
MKYLRRAMDDLRSTSAPPSPEKKSRPEAESAIRTAINLKGGGSSRGLMKFFKPCTKEEYSAQVQRFTEEHQAFRDEESRKDTERKIEREEKTREAERLRQQKHRRLKRESEIAGGERTPGGTKRKVSL